MDSNCAKSHGLKYFTGYIGNALLTVATGQLSEGESERTGLVTTHAYAVLNLAEFKVHCMATPPPPHHYNYTRLKSVTLRDFFEGDGEP